MKEDSVPQWACSPYTACVELVAFEGNSSEHQVLCLAESSALLWCMLGADLHDQTSLEQNAAHLKPEKNRHQKEINTLVYRTQTEAWTH